MNILKKQGVAWVLTIVMIVAAVGIGQAKADRGVGPEYATETLPIYEAPVSSDGYVYDEADVLSASTEKTLISRNNRLLEEMDTVIAVVTCNYGRDDLYSYALDYAEEIGLGQYDFIVVLDISGENYWLVQGNALYEEGWFSDDDCSDYAWNYMEDDFARGDYDGAVLALTEALEDWYYDNY